MKTPLHEVLRSKGNEVHTVHPEASVGAAVRTMARLGVGSLVVTSCGDVVGLVSERHVLNAIARGVDSLDRTRVRDVMDPNPVVVSPDTHVGSAMALMTERYTRHLPVVADGGLLGLVSIGDLTRWMTRALETEVEALHSYIGGAYQ